MMRLNMPKARKEKMYHISAKVAEVHINMLKQLSAKWKLSSKTQMIERCIAEAHYYWIEQPSTLKSPNQHNEKNSTSS